MAKIGFTKLSLKRKNEVKTITINNNQIEIKQYLPVNEKLDLIARVINGAHDQNNFPNPIKIEVIGTLEMIMAYTNISFTETSFPKNFVIGTYPSCSDVNSLHFDAILL